MPLDGVHVEGFGNDSCCDLRSDPRFGGDDSDPASLDDKILREPDSDGIVFAFFVGGSDANLPGELFVSNDIAQH